ncbi:hypothetical protein DV736_g1555, partial [Chaetothyriales sp. CBS 134916]
MESNVLEDLALWDEDRVVFEVCTKPDSHFARVPNRNRLEQTLRDNNINGECLLELGLDTLKHELGIASYGQRMAISKAIKTLRNSPVPFSTEEKVRRFQEGLPTPQITHSRLSLGAQSSAYFPNDTKPTIEQDIAPSPSLPQIKHGTSSAIVHLPDDQPDEEAITQPMHRLPLQCATLPPPAAPEAMNATKDGAPLPAHLCYSQPSYLNEDQSLRLNTDRHVEVPLNQSESSNVPNTIEENHKSTTPRPSRALPRAEELGKTSNTTKLKHRRRIAPTLVRSIEPWKTDLAALDADAYYGSEAMTIQDIFYPLDAVDDGRNLHLISEKRAAGFRKAVSGLMRHYLRQPTVSLPNTPFKYRIPYQAERCVGPKSRHLFSLFLKGGVHRVEPIDEWSAQLSAQSSDNTSGKYAENELAMTTGQPILSPADFDALLRPSTEGGEAIEGIGDFRYLLEKYQPGSDDSEGLPVYGDSGDENNFDDETWGEIEAERAERALATNVIPEQDVTSIIDDAIQGFEKFWQENKLPKVQAKAYSIWVQAATLRIRQPQRAAKARILSRFEVRLTSLKDAVLAEPWQKASDIRAQCQSMEETVFSILECRHILQVLERNTAPEKPNRKVVKQKSKVQVQLPEGEEILDSDDDMDAFLTDDSSSVEDIPFAQEDDFNPELPNPTPRSRSPQTKILDPISAEKPRSPKQDKAIEVAGDEADIESDEDERILSPLDKKRRSAKSLTPRKPKKHDTDVDKAIRRPESDSDSNLAPDAGSKLSRPRFSFPGQSETQTIDLTMSDPPEPPTEISSSEFDVRTPPLNPIGIPRQNASEPLNPFEREHSSQKPSTDLSENVWEPKTQVSKSLENSQQLPPLEDVPRIRRLQWEQVTTKSDRLRALHKSVYGIGEPEFRLFCTYLENIPAAPRSREQILKEGLLSLDDLQKKGEAKPKVKAPTTLLATLFVTYVCSKSITTNEVCSPLDFDKSFESVTNACKKFFTYLGEAVQIYSTFLRNAKGSSKRKAQDVRREEFIVEDESSDVPPPDEEAQHSQSTKRRKRVVAESQEAKAHQKTDQQRVLEQELRRKTMEEKFAAISSDDKAYHVINAVEPYVSLDPHIAARAKPHQIAGIQFLWREIVEDPKHQGCLLAHTMGLGKTMQVISLLVTIAQCNQSSDPNIRRHIPQHLKRSQTLILCPPTLLDNWYDEMVMWLPTNQPNILGGLHKIRHSGDSSIQAWESGGGVMIMSYDLFRFMLRPRKNKKTPIPDEDLARRKKCLLDKANLVVADEAHKMKNANSAISQVARNIKTRSRIALTGSPLNNHLEEYHTMIDWIFPGYLGAMLQFRAKYIEPIHMGLYAESTAYERRVCLKKLHVLKQDLAPKVNRADISAISKDLPPKTEYVITLPLTDWQRQAYDIYARYMLQTYGPTGNVGKQGLFSLISILTSLCNHPWIFMRKFDKRLNRPSRPEQVHESGKEPGAEAGLDESDAANSPEAGIFPEIDAASPTTSDISAMEEAVAVFRELQTLGRLQDANLSYRAVVVQQILQKSMLRGDKVLVFSHSLDTLDYLGLLLDQMKAGGLGLNFQGANRVIIYDFGFNPMWEEQAVGRAYRLGQKQPVHVYRFKIGGTVEEVVINKAIFKTQLFSRVVDKKNPTRQASNRASDYLFLARDAEQREFKDCLGKDAGVLDAIIEESDEIRNVELTETFHKEDDEKLNAQELKEAEEEYNRQRLERDDPEAYQKKYGNWRLPIYTDNLTGMSSPSHQPAVVGSKIGSAARHQPAAQLGVNPGVVMKTLNSVALSQIQDGKAIPGLRHSSKERAKPVDNLTPKNPNTNGKAESEANETAENRNPSPNRNTAADVNRPASPDTTAKPGTPTKLNTPGCQTHVGAYIALEVIKLWSERRRSETGRGTWTPKAAILLMPTVIDLHKSPSGQMATPLLSTVPFVPELLQSAVSALRYGLPQSWLKGLVSRVTGMKEGQGLETTVNFVASTRGVNEALHLARDEVAQIRADKWGEEIWGTAKDSDSDSADSSRVRPALYFLFAQRDHWVADATRKQIVDVRGGSARRIAIDKEEGLAHAWPLRSTGPVVKIVLPWIQEVLLEATERQQQGSKAERM